VFALQALSPKQVLEPTSTALALQALSPRQAFLPTCPVLLAQEDFPRQAFLLIWPVLLAQALLPRQEFLPTFPVLFEQAASPLHEFLPMFPVFPSHGEVPFIQAFGPIWMAALSSILPWQTPSAVHWSLIVRASPSSHAAPVFVPSQTTAAACTTHTKFSTVKKLKNSARKNRLLTILSPHLWMRDIPIFCRLARPP
jgi:hypothetical protein